MTTFQLAPIAERAADESTLYHPAEIELADLTKTVLERVEAARPARVVFDSLSELRLLARDPLRYRRQILGLKDFFSRSPSTVLLLDDHSAGEADLQLRSLAHGVLLLEHLPFEYGRARRRLRIVKLRGTAVTEGFHDFIIARGGLTVFPQLDATDTGATPDRTPRRHRQRVERPGRGQGARFEVRLPTVEGTAEISPAQTPQASRVSLDGRSILIVDDDESTREVVATALEAAHADVQAAASAREAREWLQQHAPALIIADLGMPVEDGFSLMRDIRKRLASDVPAIALSAYADQRSRNAALAAGFNAFLAKPTRPDALLRLVGAMLNDANASTKEPSDRAH